jgi:hypothetical protein
MKLRCKRKEKYYYGKMRPVESVPGMGREDKGE